jgi:hypothetical protein
VGDYWSEELGVTYRLGIEDGNLKLAAVLDRSGLPRANNFLPNDLRHAGTDEFAIGHRSVTLKFKRDGQGAASEFVLDAGRTTGMTFTRLGTSPP